MACGVAESVAVARLTKETVVGLDLGVEQISLAQVDVHGTGPPHLAHVGQAPLTPGLGVEDVASAIRSLWKERHLSCYTVASCFRSPSAIVRHFRFPSLNDEELGAALGLEAEEVLQLDPDEIALDWHERPVKATGPSDSRGREGVLVAVPRAELDRHRETLEMAGLVPIVVDVGCTAMSNTFMALRGDECREQAVCVANLAGRMADAAILYDGNAMYPRCIMDLGDGDRRARRLADSLTDVLKYYEFKLRQEPVSDLVLTGHAPDIEALCADVQQRIGLPVSLWNPCRDMKITSTRVRRMLDERPDLGRNLAVAIGVAMRR